MKVHDLTGMRFGWLEVRSYSGTNDRREAMWLCECVCGKERVVVTASLKSGRTASCGCKSAHATGERNRLRNVARARTGRGRRRVASATFHDDVEEFLQS